MGNDNKKMVTSGNEKTFKDARIQRLYENCRSHMKNTIEDWCKVVESLKKLYDKLPDESKNEALEMYNTLSKEIK